MARNSPFTSKYDGMARAHRYHVCLSCRHNQPETFTACPKCGVKNRVHFPSKAEMHRAMSLMLLEQNGNISDLKFHPKYLLVVNDIDICVYIADAEYKKNGEIVTEDSKPLKFMDKASQLKIKLFQAIWGRKVLIVKS